MKYIRTKDGRILEINKMVNPCVYETKPNKQGVYEEIGNGWVDKVADTIEELCDEFVIVGTNWQQIIDLEDAKYNCDKHDNLKIYGAIWTNKGLIYVAKMNDEGKLELL